MNAIVLTLNGCSLAALGPYGNEWIATPNLDRLAAEAVTFDRQISCCPDPVAARRTWLTGLPTSEPSSRNLLHELREAGIHTVLVRHNRPENDGPPEFYAGWGELFDARPDPHSTSSPAEVLFRLLPQLRNKLHSHEKWLLWIDCDRLLPPWDAPQELFDIYVEELVQDESEPQAQEASTPADTQAQDLWVGDSATDSTEESDDEAYPQEEEYEVEVDDDSDIEDEEAREIIPPWLAPPIGWFDRDDLPSWELLHRSYAAAVTAFDADLGKLFQFFREQNWHQDANWVLTADRGFPLGEHRMIGPHRPWLYEELVHVPLMIRPSGLRSGKHVAALTQPADLVATLAQMLGLSAFPADGASLLPWLESLQGPSRDFAISRLESEWAIRTPEWTLLQSVETDAAEGEEPRQPVQLYQMPDDRWEVNDVWRQHEVVVEELLARLEPFRSGTGGPN